MQLKPENMVKKTGLYIPAITFDCLNGDSWSSNVQCRSRFTLLVTYRGPWCKFCQKQLTILEQLANEFTENSVELVVVSMGDKRLAQEMQSKLKLEGINIGYGLTLEQARSLGLFISSKQQPHEPNIFSEPGTYLLDNNKTVLATWIASNAYARVNPRDVLDYIKFVTNKKPSLPRGAY